MNGEFTLGENLADNGGVKVAYLAYRQWVKEAKVIEDHLPGFERFSSNEMFWLIFGQLWCSVNNESKSSMQFVKYK